MKERVVVDMLRVANPHIQKVFPDAQIREVSGSTLSYPMPAVSHGFRSAAEVTDIVAVDDRGWMRRFLLQKGPRIPLEPVPMVEIANLVTTVDDFLLTEVPYDSLYASFLNTSHVMNGNGGQASVTIRRVVASLVEQNPDLAARIKERYGVGCRVTDTLSVSIRHSTLIYVG